MPTGNLPKSATELWERVYQDALKGSCKDDKGCAAGSAWKAVKNAGWYKDESGNWHKKAIFTEFSMRIEKVAYEKATNQRRWRMVASDTDEDLHSDEMSIELFNDFVGRIARKEQPPEEYRSEFWNGGEPYVSVSHYPDFNGDGVPGVSEATFVDGTYLKAKGLFLDTPLGRKCFEAVCEDMYGIKSTIPANKIRVSIAFLDFAHEHKSNGFYFERTEETPICMECIKEFLSKEYAGKIFRKGLLIHYALTRVPANERTELEVEKSMADKSVTRQMDAESIVGEEEAQRLEEAAQLVGKSVAELSQPELIIRSDAEDKKEDEMEDETPTKGKKKKGDEKKSEVAVADSEKSLASLTISTEEAKEHSVIPPEPVDIASVVRSIVAEEVAKMSVPATVTKVEHPLDASYKAFCNRYDEIVKMDISAEERLRLLQTDFNALGQQIIESVRSIPEPTSQPVSPETALVNAISQAFAPLAAKMDTLLNKIDASQSTTPTVPTRRSLQPPSTFTPPPDLQAKSLTKDGKMSIRGAVERTT